MALATAERAPSREDFAALLEESYGGNEAFEGSVVKGIVVAIERELGIPVKYVGIGEGVDDLIVFEPRAFVDSLLDA